jgi:hypothetical protein
VKCPNMHQIIHQVVVWEAKCLRIEHECRCLLSAGGFDETRILHCFRYFVYNRRRIFSNFGVSIVGIFFTKLKFKRVLV